MNITLPTIKPREYQIPFLAAMDRGLRRAALIWHRRSGKDTTALAYCSKSVMGRVGMYLHSFPTLRQGRKIIWDGRDREGKPFLDAFPDPIIEAKNNTEMKLTLKNGSIYQVVGSDSLDSLVGANPLGLVLSEYALQNPMFWRLMSPIVRENKGYAVFCYTPRGRNHGHDLWEMAKTNPDWYASLLTVNDTRRDDGSMVYSPEDIDSERKDGLSEELIQQEYYCSFEGFVEGSIFGEEMKLASVEGRICGVPHNPKLQVVTAWDLGVDDSTTIWFFQMIPGGEIRAIDYLEDRKKGLPYYAQRIKEKPYVYAEHLMPFDVGVMEMGTGKTRKETAESLGISPIRTVPKWGTAEGIAAVRLVLPRMWFDSIRCNQGIECLRSYHREKDEEKKVFLAIPEHDWSSHGADAMRAFAVGFRELSKKREVIRQPLPVFIG